MGAVRAMRDLPTTAFVKDRLDKLIEERGWTAKRLAEAGGVSEALISQVRGLKHGVSTRSIDRLRELLNKVGEEFFEDLFALNRAVEQWWKTEGQALTSEKLPDEPFPRRALAVEILRKALPHGTGDLLDRATTEATSRWQTIAKDFETIDWMLHIGEEWQRIRATEAQQLHLRQEAEKRSKAAVSTAHKLRKQRKKPGKSGPKKP